MWPSSHQIPPHIELTKSETLEFWLILMLVSELIQFVMQSIQKKLPFFLFFNYELIGKTTTTERMLFYSGKTNYLGEVHRGNTVTDFLSQERERGITICSSAVAFNWDDYRVNLLDTPGHIDFTMEVEQSLNAVDGIVVILDASAGVEAQTITVWTQADRHKLPRMVFANKMDRADADFDQCLMDVKMKLNALPVAIQEPIMGKKGINGIYK